MSKATAVYLVEDHTDPEPAPYTRYFAHVYLSRDKAKAGVEHQRVTKVFPAPVAAPR